MQDSYREIFISESLEYLGNISKSLVKLEVNPDDPDSINEIFRCVHTLKGMSATMGFDKLTQLSHQMEDLLDELRNRRKKVTSTIIDELFACVDVLESLVEEIKFNRDNKINITPVLEGLKKFLRGQEKDKEIAEPATESKDFTEKELKTLNEAKGRGFNIFKVKVYLARDCAMKGARAFLIITNLERLSQILKSIPTLEDLKSGNFNFSFTIILITKERLEVIREELLNISEVDDVGVEVIEILQARPTVAEQATPSLKKIESIRIPVERLDKIMNLMGELAIAKIRLMQVVGTYKIDPLEEVAFMLDRLSSSLQDEIMQTRLLPVAYILDTFPRVVRDLARMRNKEVVLEIIGGEIELDRVVLNEIGDPLVHLIRNAIDHGIESPQERQALHKSPQGKLLIKVSRQKGQILIEVIDDGKGVDFAAVRRTALNKGLISQEEAQTLDNKKVLDLISLPGFSTAEKISEISGRGVGLDVVKSKMDTLGGRLDFETKPGEGSRFMMTLPLTLAIIKAMLVKVVNEIFAIPLMSIRETLKLKEDEIKMLQNFEVIRVREEVIPIIRLEKELGILPSQESEKGKLNGKISVVIVEYGQKSIGLAVNQVLGEQDIVVKPLGSLVKRTKGIAGATILGDGRVALILDILSLR